MQTWIIICIISHSEGIALNGIFACATENFIKYIWGYIILMFIIPCFMFTRIKGDTSKSIVCNYIKMTFWIIVTGYITVLLRLFELITFVAAVFIFIAYKYYKDRAFQKTAIKDNIGLLVINHVDNVERIEKKILKFVTLRLHRFIYKVKTLNTSELLMLLAVFGYAAYLHFYDCFTSAAPASGTYQLIEKMKYISLKPQGLGIVMAVMQKVQHINHLYVIRFTYPLLNLLASFGLYWFASRLAHKTGGIIAAMLFGVLGPYLTGATLYQYEMETVYAAVFYLPVLYFFYQYACFAKKEDFFAAFFGCAVTGLLDIRVFCFLFAGLFTLLVAKSLVDFRKDLLNMLVLFALLLTAATIAVIPLIIGVLTGTPFDFSQYFTVVQGMPAVSNTDIAGLVSAGIILLSLPLYNKDISALTAKVWVILLGIVSFAGFMYGGMVTNGVVELLWHFTLPVVISFACLSVFDALKLTFRFRHTFDLACLALIITVFAYFPQKPVTTQKQGNDSNIMQYLKICQTFRPTQWMIVSWQEEYSLALGYGYHMMLDEFIEKYPPDRNRLINREDNKTLKTEDIFIFVGKKRLEAVPDIYEWLYRYGLSHDKLTLFYHDGSLEVWRIHQEVKAEDRHMILWEY